MYLNKAGLQGVCGELIADLDGVLPLKWDGNFQALLAEFPSENQNSICSILETHLNQKYDIKTIRNAPEHLRKRAGLFGDLRSNQALFTSDPKAIVLIFVAWWPWADGERISIRIA